jgi:hypothetical protein
MVLKTSAGTRNFSHDPTNNCFSGSFSYPFFTKMSPNYIQDLGLHSQTMFYCWHDSIQTKHLHSNFGLPLSSAVIVSFSPRWGMKTNSSRKKRWSHNCKILITVVPPRNLPPSRMCVITIARIGTKAVVSRICGSVLCWDRTSIVGETAVEVWLGVRRRNIELVGAGRAGGCWWGAVYGLLVVDGWEMEKWKNLEPGPW